MKYYHTQLYTENKFTYLEPAILKEQYNRRPSITKQCIQTFADNCPYSYHKCESNEEAKEKIYKMYFLGTEIERDVIDPEMVYFHYGNRAVVYDSVTDEIISIIHTSSDKVKNVPELMKAEYDHVIQKIII